MSYKKSLVLDYFYCFLFSLGYFIDTCIEKLIISSCLYNKKLFYKAFFLNSVYCTNSQAYNHLIGLIKVTIEKSDKKQIFFKLFI